jgi:hypothetical protein
LDSAHDQCHAATGAILLRVEEYTHFGISFLFHFIGRLMKVRLDIADSYTILSTFFHVPNEK